MRQYRKIGLMVLVVLFLLPLSCSEDFITQENTQGATAENLFGNAENGVRLVNGIYDTFHNVDFIVKALWYQANFLSQDFKNYGADTFFETYEVPTGFAALQVFWARAYEGIARANSAIPIIADMRSKNILTDALADRLTGEVYFLRGVFYYYLASNFGGVPLELKTVTDGGYHPRNTEDEVFAAVASDMETAASLLPWQQDLASTDIGRATKGAALAYLGDAQMWLKKYSDAVATYEKLTGRYALETEFVNIHEYNNQNGKESIFEVQFIEGADMSWNHANDSHWMTTFGMPWEATQFGYSYADKRLYDSFEPGDKRKLSTVIGPDDPHPSPALQIKTYPLVVEGFASADPATKARYTGFDGNIINTCGTVVNNNIWKGDDKLRSGYYSTKTWRDPKAVGNSGDSYIFSGQNIILMRYGQVLISKAEALFQDNKSSAALDIINNQVRNRAGLGPAAGTDVMNIILEEYRHELSGEFSLWFLLRRSGKHLQYVKDRYGISVPPGKDLMPIPQREIGVNPELKQNPGY